MTDRGYRNLNNSVLRLLLNALKDVPTADLENVLHKAYSTYTSMRRNVEKRLKGMYYIPIRYHWNAKIQELAALLMREDHRIVLTHGDFHPRNIIVTDEPDGVTTISGIIDWEMARLYPERWEILKAMNARALTDPSD
ncbi:uncharacterized protein ARMOST_05780 [Armillaria ostoyae]|uniref:Aminoglycoside phosphotransferase domain-containing protein n=1 Tax=Armillaria ostoyae TaxID=47428 RepID=A0A284R149_ARMOS|nr:uncharacterized protein ARMOST_05780 [Armillaria ostoyae]